MSAPAVEVPEDDGVEAKNALIGQQLIALIQEVHNGMRPFVLIFPALDGDARSSAQALTNISSVPYLRNVLREHLRATKTISEFERIPKASMN